MSFKRKMIVKLSILYVMAAVLIILGLGKDSPLMIMGISMAGASTVFLVRLITAANKNKLTEMENVSRDERTAFITMKSYSLAFWISLVAEFVVLCVLYWFAMENESTLLNSVICFQVAVFVISYFIYNKKY